MFTDFLLDGKFSKHVIGLFVCIAITYVTVASDVVPQELHSSFARTFLKSYSVQLFLKLSVKS